MTYETKADAIESVFEATPDTGAEITQLRAEMARLATLVTTRGVTRPALAGAKADAAAPAFAETWLRHGTLPGDGIKAASIGVGPKGGVAVPVEIDAVIDMVLRAASPIRSIAQVVDVGSANYRKLITTSGVVSGWVSETGARAETETPDFAEIAPPMGELYANPAASQAMLDDAFFDVEAWLGGEIGREFARAEGVAFVTGDGVNKPRGFLSAPNSAADDATRAFGTLADHRIGGRRGLCREQSAGPADRPRPCAATPYRQGAVFVMNSATLARIRKFKDTIGRLPVAAGAVRRSAGDAARLSGGRGGGHARCRRRQPVDRVRQLPGGLPDRPAPRDGGAARSLLEQAVRAFLCHQARRRHGDRQPGDQADEVQRLSRTWAGTTQVPARLFSQANEVAMRNFAFSAPAGARAGGQG